MVSDFRPISLIGIQYKIIAKILANRLGRVIGDIVSPEQTAFIKGRQILDGPFLINEVINWYKRKKKKLLLFKIDFSKAYDSLSWEYLFAILKVMGFGSKWLNWIKACLTSTRSSVIVNGSPTDEFLVERGLRQGDPMAPLLFIIAMEGLHVAIEQLVNGGMFLGANINNVILSHLFYADDVMIVGHWDERNLRNIINAFKFFHCISGLKINLEKSSLIDIGVEGMEVNRMARISGCKLEDLPFKYLGIPIGGSPARIKTWEPILTKFQKRLSNWKASLLSIGGRATLVSSVLGSLGTYFLSLFRLPKKVRDNLESVRARFFWGGTANKRKIAWTKWGTIIADKDDGGLGFGNLESMNHALLYKWRWRALQNPSSTWVKIVSAIHGEDCFMNLIAKHRGLWHTMVTVANQMHKESKEISGCIYRKVGNGYKTKFWKDIWCGETNLAHQFPRLFALEVNKDCNISDCWNNSGWAWTWRRPICFDRETYLIDNLKTIIPKTLEKDVEDTWCWNFLGKKWFSVAEIRKHLDHKRLPIDRNMKTRWNKLLPKKINIFIWRLQRNSLPTLVNLFAKGIDISTCMCINCRDGAEFEDHTFQKCRFNAAVRHLLCGWVHQTIPDASTSDVVTWCDNLKISKKARTRLHAIISSWWWHIWKIRNNKYHNGSNEDTIEAYNAIVSTTFLWIKYRDSRSSLTWDAWLLDPLSL